MEDSKSKVPGENKQMEREQKAALPHLPFQEAIREKESRQNTNKKSKQQT